MTSHRDTQSLLRRQPLFAACSRRALAALSTLCHVARFRPGQRLTQEGQRGIAFYTLLDGDATVERRGRLLTHSLPGTAVGERALLLHTRRNATVTAATSVDTLAFTELDFYEACNLSAGFERAVVAAALSHA